MQRQERQAEDREMGRGTDSHRDADVRERDRRQGDGERDRQPYRCRGAEAVGEDVVFDRRRPVC